MSEEFSRFRVLVADDEVNVANSMAQLMSRRLGARFTSVYDGNEALKALEADPCDVLITDMQMPGIHGLELVQKVASQWPAIPVIVMTAYPHDFPYVDVIKSGAADFIAKPYHPEELEAKILRLFREIALREEHTRQREKILNDLEELKRARAAQELAEEKYRRLFECSMNGMLLMNPDTLEVYEVNKAFCDLIGATRGEVLHMPFLDLLDEHHQDRFTTALRMFQERTHGTLADMMMNNREGKPLLLDVSISYIHLDHETVLMVMFKDVTEQREMQRQISEMASTDSLTGLLNQRMFYIKLEAAVRRADRNDDPLVLMFVDLDNFKTCNDQFGHQTGDDLLRSVGEVVRKHIRAERDFGFRYGGDEFAVLLSGASIDVAAQVGERIRAEFDSTDRYGTSMSIGIAQYREGMSGDAFVKAADEALYSAKDAGKNTVRAV